MGTKYGIVQLYCGENMRYWLRTDENRAYLRQTARLLSAETEKFYALAEITGSEPSVLEYVYVGGKEYENVAGVVNAAPDGAVTFPADVVPA
jgi:hypothetical protein